MGNNFSWRKPFADCSLLLPKDAMPPNFAAKTFMNSHKTLKFVKVFFLEVSHHTVLICTGITPKVKGEKHW